jgi:hypothetical protein
MSCKLTTTQKKGAEVIRRLAIVISNPGYGVAAG